MLEQHAAGERAEGDADSRGARPDRDRRWRSTGSVKTFVMIDNVAGKISAAPTPVIARIAISAVGRVDHRGSQAAEPEHDEPERERSGAAEPVAEARR